MPLQRSGLAGLDRRDAQQDDASQLAGDRLAHLVHFKAEGCLGDGGVGLILDVDTLVQMPYQPPQPTVRSSPPTP